MVVYLTVDGQDLFAVWREQWLTAALWVDNTQSLVSEDGCTTTIDTTPVWSAMADLLTQTQCLLSQFLRLLLYMKDCYNSTHNLSFFTFSPFHFFTFSPFHLLPDMLLIFCQFALTDMSQAIVLVVL